MRVLSLLLMLVMVGCGPSAQQVTATAVAAMAQTQTAAPTITPTLTPTITPSPTSAPSPTPAIPMVQGRVQMKFVGLDDKTIIPKPPFELTVNLTTGDTQIPVETSPEDGSFTTYLEPGTYTIESISVQHEAFDAKVQELVADGTKIEIPSQACYFAGAITFTAIRLPPGSFETQVALVQKLAQGQQLFFSFLETGGLLMPVLTESAGTGACANLPTAPDGFHWKYLPESGVAVLAPDQWHFLSEQSKTARSYFISLENIGMEGAFKTGMTIHVQRDEGRDAMQDAKGLPATIIELAKLPEPVEVVERAEGDMTFYEFEYQAALPLDITVYNMITANQITNTLYVITFESPTGQWDEAWKTGQAMIEQLVFLDNK